jgi:RNA polymerase sigma-70 factor (ECF subfamily)
VGLKAMSAPTGSAPTPDDLAAAVRRLQEGRGTDGDARWVYAESFPAVLGYFRRQSLRPEECDDLSQSTFLRVFENIRSYRHESSLKTWILVIARNVLLNEVRRPASPVHYEREEGLERLESLAPGDLPTAVLAGREPEDDPWEAAWRSERREAFLKAAEELPEQMRRCVLLYYRGKDYGDIARLLGIEASTVRVQVFQAKKRLTALLSPDLPDGPAGRGRGGTGK